MIDFAEVRIVLVSAVVGAFIGAAYTFVVHHAPLVGLLIGAAFGTVFPTIEILLFKGEAGAQLRRSPFLVFLGVRIAIYLVLIVAIEISSVWLFYGRAAIGEIGLADIAFALLISFLFNLLHAVADLLGPGVLFAFAAGRYHNPRPEERALLFIDLCGSTAKAERLGDARFLDFLDAFLADVSRDIVENGGEIHKYVGDEIIATWRLRNGRDNSGIVRAYLAAHDRLAARREAYRREFGEGAEFRAALHIGVVMLGEVGSFKKEVALIGDPMNTAARILDACRALGRPALASRALVKPIGALPASVRSDAIAPLALRGKAEPLELVALEPP